MARRRNSEGFHRREHEARERRRQRLIMLIAGSVLGVAVVLLVVGVLFTVVLPPRASALVVGGEQISAAQVADRARTVDLFEGLRGVAGSGQVVDFAIERLVRDEALRRAAGPLTEEVTDEEVRAATQRALSMPEEMTDEQFEVAYRGFLESTGLSRADVEQMMRAQVLRERLREQLEEEVEESGPQVRTLTVRSRDEGRIAELRDRTLEGEDFVEVAIELGLAESEEAIDRGWRAEEALAESVLEAIEGLEAGEVSGIVHEPDAFEFVVHYIAERDEDREYDDATRTQVAQTRLTERVDEEREALEVRVELSARERDWVVRQVQRAR